MYTNARRWSGCARSVAAALDRVLDLAKYLADLVFDGAGAAGTLIETAEVGKQAAVDEVAQAVAGESAVVVRAALGILRRGPALPAEGFGQDEAVGPAFQLGLGRAVSLQHVQVFHEKHPGRLLGSVQLAGAAGILVQDVVDVLESLLGHVWSCP